MGGGDEGGRWGEEVEGAPRPGSLAAQRTDRATETSSSNRTARFD